MIQLTTINDKRILLNIKDFKAVLETDSGTKIIFYSDNNSFEFVKEDYDTVYNKITRKEDILNYLNRTK